MTSRASEPAIECRGLWKVFGHPRQVASALDQLVRGSIGREGARQQHNCIVGVQDVSFTVQRGEIFCIIGLSGSGKSTLIRHINRLVEPSAGDIRIDGRSIRGLNAARLRRLRAERIGMVFQNFALLPHRTVEDNAGLSLELRGLAPHERAVTVSRVLETVGLGGWGGRQVWELSGGMQQRVGLARALAADPEILLMDEPFSALDPLIRRQLQDEFLRLSRRAGKTTVFITHDLDEAMRIGDRIAIMKDGRIIQVGTPEDIVLDPADAFVADFVEGISRLDVVTARRLMEPVTDPDEARALPEAPPETRLRDLLKLAKCGPSAVAVCSQGRLCGVVPIQRLIDASLAERDA